VLGPLGAAAGRDDAGGSEGDATVKAPFPWFGGKRRVAPEVWARFGDVAVYCEPFFGSGAVLLGRPEAQWRDGRVETVNDLDGFVCNAWRAILHDPEATAHHADWPVNENDLHARNAWLVERRESFRARLEGDPDYFDAKVAGWWLWGMSCWIGAGFAAPSGPWARVDGQLAHLGDAGRGVTRQLAHLGNAGRGVTRKLVHLGNAGRGVTRKLVHLGNAGRGDAGNGEQGLAAWLAALSERLRGVRVCSGDWSRIMSESAMAVAIPGPRGVFLDPPYGASDRSATYAEESFTVAADVLEWCKAHGDDADKRIALCGYEGEAHHELDVLGWTVHAWEAQGGMQRDKTGGNRMRERIWFSPGCLNPNAAGPRQMGLFG